jgi:hypothetical protein
MADGHELRFPLRGMLPQEIDRSEPLARGLPCGVVAPAHLSSRRLPVGAALLHGRMRNTLRRTAAPANIRVSHGGCGHRLHATAPPAA